MKKIQKLFFGLKENLSFLIFLLGLVMFIIAGFLIVKILGFFILGVSLILTSYILSPTKGGVNR